jgi:phage tail sheath protein FI
MLPAVTPPILGVATSTTGLVGEAAQGPVEQAVLVTSLVEFEQVFGMPQPGQELFLGARQFFLNGGVRAWTVRLGARSAAGIRRGLAALDAVDDLGLLCFPGLSGGTTLAAAAAYARSRGTFYLAETAGSRAATITAVRGIRAADRGHAAAFFPRLRVVDPLQPGSTTLCGSSATIAGLLARTDIQRGVSAFAAGTGTHLQGAVGLASAVGEQAAAKLRGEGVNAIRQVPTHGIVVWGARTVGSGREQGEDWKYVPVRRTALYIGESIEHGIGWADFEPNDEPLWRRLRDTVGSFLTQMFHEGAFAGATPGEAFSVRCGSDTTTQRDIDNGILVIEIGFAPLRPAEFVTFCIRHKRR